MTPASGKLALPKGYIMFKKIMATTAIALMLAAPMPASANHGWSGDREARAAARAEQRAERDAERAIDRADRDAERAIDRAERDAERAERRATRGN